MWKIKNPRIAQKNLEKKSNQGRLTLFDLQSFYRSKHCVLDDYGQTYRSMNGNETRTKSAPC